MLHNNLRKIDPRNYCTVADYFVNVLTGECATSKFATDGILRVQTDRSRWHSTRLCFQVAV